MRDSLTPARQALLSGDHFLAVEFNGNQPNFAKSRVRYGARLPFIGHGDLQCGCTEETVTGAPLVTLSDRPVRHVLAA